MLIASLGMAGRAQDPAIPRDRAIAFLQYPEHGLSTMPGVWRKLVLSDPSTLSFYADLVDGRTRADTAWSLDVAIWLLAGSDTRSGVMSRAV